MIYKLLKPLLFRIEAEQAHELVTALFRQAAHVPLAARLLQQLYVYESAVLTTSCAGMRFANPLGLAAGFDKRGELASAMALLGFGHIEVGTVTPRPQPGNQQPRLFRLSADAALINRMGFNSPGMLTVAASLQAQRGMSKDHRALTMAGASSPSSRPSSAVVGVNIGKNRDTPLERAAEDYVAAFMALAPLADYVTVNISSPNTPSLRQLHERAALEELLGALRQENARLAHKRPLFLKISPDETPAIIEEVVRAGMEGGCTGFVATNTSLAREALRSQTAHEAGGLSGRPLAARARATVGRIYRLTNGAVPVIGAGGVASASDAYAMIRAGASLVQLYTGLIYQGPGIAREITRGLAELLWRDGHRNVADAVGADSTT